MPPEPAVVAAAPRPPGLRLISRPLRVADVALFYGERSGGIRTYLDARALHAASTAAFEHHLVVPGATDGTVVRPGGDLHTIRAVTVNRANGYRVPLAPGALARKLAAIAPDIVVLHDPFWQPRGAARAAQAACGVVVMAHHGSADLDAHAWPGPSRLYARAIRAWLHRAYAGADAVMSACDPHADTGRRADLPLRLGVHAAFRPRADVARGDHVLYAGRIAREKGVFTLLDACARSRERWPLRLVGSGPAADAVRSRSRRLGISDRVELRPYIHDPERLAREYAGARCVVMPGPLETFGLVALEAAACAAPVVAAYSAPAARAIGPALCHVFEAGDAGDLAEAIAGARAAPRDPYAAAVLAERHRWDAVLEAELRDLRELLR